MRGKGEKSYLSGEGVGGESRQNVGIRDGKGREGKGDGGGDGYIVVCVLGEFWFIVRC